MDPSPHVLPSSSFKSPSARGTPLSRYLSSIYLSSEFGSNPFGVNKRKAHTALFSNGFIIWFEFDNLGEGKSLVTVQTLVPRSPLNQSSRGVCCLSLFKMVARRNPSIIEEGSGSEEIQVERPRRSQTGHGRGQARGDVGGSSSQQPEIVHAARGERLPSRRPRATSWSCCKS